MKTLIVLIILALGAVLMWFAIPAHAAFGCGNFDLFAQSLAKKYNEAPTGIGIAADGNLIYVIFTSPAGTWTAIGKAADGSACIVAAGRDWQNIKYKAPETKL